MNSISQFLLKTKGNIVTAHIELQDTRFIGKKGKLTLYLETKTLHSRPVDQKKIVKTFDIDIPSQKFHIDLNTQDIQAYSYLGTTLHIDCKVSFSIDDSIFFDSKVEGKVLENIFQRPTLSNNAKSIIDPKDSFNLVKNLQAIKSTDRVQVLGGMLLGGIIVLINTYIGWHDQMSPEYATYFYSHINSDGETTSPFLNSLAGSGAVGVAVWAFIKTRLRRYMTFVLKQVDFLDDAKKQYSLPDLLSWKTKCDLHNSIIRIVAGNIEKTQHKETRGSGKRRRTVTVSTQVPVRALVLFEQKLDFIPRGGSIENYVTGSFCFGDMHKVLYPELQVSSTHGLFLHWEVQLLSPDFIDQEIICPTNFFQYKSFLKS